jgi:pyruvate formate lyase activating enzyme
MKCFWCHNPEGRLPRSEVQYFPEKCISCGECVQVCPNHAHILKDDKHIFIRELCQGAGECVKVCYSEALDLSGKVMSVDEIMEEIMRDSIFYDTSGGGVTLSGGEPVLNGDLSKELLNRCKEEALHTTIETCGNYPWEKLENLLPLIDLVMMDIKHINSQKHKQVTGNSNELILANARQLATTNKPILFRTPVIPTVNDTVEEITEISNFVKSLMEMRKNNGQLNNDSIHIQFELLSFHRLATDKYRSLELEYKARDFKSLEKEKFNELVNVAKSIGLDVRNE